MKLFYSHLLTNYHQLLDLINQLPVSRQEKTEALDLVNKTIHYLVVDVILENTDERYHQRIIGRIQALPDDRGILDLVNSLTEMDIEHVLRQRLTGLEMELLEDLMGGDE